MDGIIERGTAHLLETPMPDRVRMWIAAACRAVVLKVVAQRLCQRLGRDGGFIRAHAYIDARTGRVGLVYPVLAVGLAVDNVKLTAVPGQPSPCFAILAAPGPYIAIREYRQQPGIRSTGMHIYIKGPRESVAVVWRHGGSE